jgi:hypothetical protein
MKKIILGLVLFFIYSQNLYSQTSDYKYAGRLKDGISHGQGTFTYKNGSTCAGIWNGHFSGKNIVCTKSTGVKYYEGEFKNGKRDGQGTTFYESGNKHIGQYKDGNREGNGTFISANGDKYVGAYKDNKRDGRGTLTWVSGNKYTGSWKEDKKIEGLLEFKEGNYLSYKGKFLDNKFHYYGELTFRNGSNYSGEFSWGKLDGNGVFTDNGEEFLLEHQNGVMVYASNLNEKSNKNRDIDLENIVDILLSTRGSGGYGDIISSGLNAMSRQGGSSTNQMRPLIERSFCTEMVISRNPYTVREVCR